MKMIRITPETKNRWSVRITRSGRRTWVKIGHVVRNKTGVLLRLERETYGREVPDVLTLMGHMRGLRA